ncbi:peptidase C39 family protein [Promicromonospora sp. NPDC060204]|uniref:peptidase C39 family protein n=1 Tax=Promicromonospora sp. NPDC060204 TaxID=3347071 RepID=UPI0036642D84
MTDAHTVVVPYDPAALPEGLARIAPDAVLDRWRSADRSAHAPRLVVLDDGTGAALVTARPATAYLKIVDAVGDAVAAARAVVALARAEGLVQVKWEGWTAGPDAAAAGFAPLRAPSAADADQPPTGFVRWLDDAVHESAGHANSPAEPPHYRQTTHFTCGPSAALMAQAHRGAIRADELDRRLELSLWREATNFPSCDPVRLGLAVQRRWPDSAVAVSLDTDRPVFVDAYPEGDRDWRTLLQEVSREEAAAAGLPVDGRHLTLPGLRAALEDGERLLLLVSLQAMLGFDVPHWVLCHGVVPGAVLLEDPWIGTTAGETWVDAHLLPVADDALDAMSRMEEPGYRAAVRIS